ncbi:YraN family protein [Celeribacter naphthalenivorans]|uniref:YraN family protein n=1 Tax=Celeribacter naphthalenivorans TaxID=1614694 RepID=UPI001CFA68E7|nr:YraN family protein [Celeribacter naphthalenivorans]
MSAENPRRIRGEQAYHFGLSAEDIVARHYTERGYELLERRWRGAGGEIDLIFRIGEEGDEIVFVEVKASKTHARASAALGARQQARLCASAEDYIGRLPSGLLTPMRIDVALVNGVGEVECLENALM